MKKTASLCVALLSIGSFATIANAAVTGSYMGAGLGYSKLETDYNQSFNDVGVQTSQSNNRGGLGGRIFGGYNFNEYFGIEAGINHYAPSKYNLNMSSFYGKGALDAKVEMNAFDVVAKGYLPLGDNSFNLYALGGLALVHVKGTAHGYINDYLDSSENLSMSTSKTENKIRPMFGIGASYDIPQTNLTSSVELSRIQGMGKDIPDADMLSWNLIYNIG